MLEQTLRHVGSMVETRLAEVGRTARLAASAAERILIGPWRGERLRLRSTIAQLSRAGEGSLPLVAMIAFLVGMILALQSAHTLRQLGTVRLVADLVALSITRELAPLITAILVVGRVGSAIAAELGTMRVSREVDALVVMGFDPVSFLVVPRLLGLVLALPCLTLFADLVGILGGAVIATTVLGLGVPGYWSDSLAALRLDDVWSGVIKSLCFGAITALVCCQKGLDTRGGADEVGRSTTSAVVRSIVLVIVADLVFTAWFYLRE
ncbi:MAG TPA: ABC transporter permease [Thermoanaerobaculia bacterium]